jgi:ribose transport system ATP-binding protein
MTVTVEEVPRLEIHGASKTFRGRKVLRDVHLTIRPGEIHGVVGQNGSGKSTLAKIISGYHGPDAGAQLRVDGIGVHLPVRLRDLHAAGVSIVYQDLGLLPDKSIVANVRIGSVEGSKLLRRVDWSAERADAVASLTRLGFDAGLSTPVTDLKPADRALVAIARALQDRHAGRGLIVFDESTRALPEDALAGFWKTIRGLTSEGTSILMIGHRLSEILEHCDRVSVLRDGECVASGLDTSQLSESELAAVMLGQELAHLSFPARTSQDVIHAARLTSLRGAGLDVPFDLTIGPGEIVGLAGLPGSGYDRLPYLIGRASPVTHGQLTLDPRPLIWRPQR